VLNPIALLNLSSRLWPCFNEGLVRSVSHWSTQYVKPSGLYLYTHLAEPPAVGNVVENELLVSPSVSPHRPGCALHDQEVQQLERQYDSLSVGFCAPLCTSDRGWSTTRAPVNSRHQCRLHLAHASKFRCNLPKLGAQCSRQRRPSRSRTGAPKIWPGRRRPALDSGF